MSRGKYGARAANRLAELDSGLAADLRVKFRQATAERDEARREAAALRDKLATEVHRAARELSERRIAEVAASLIAEQQGRREDAKRLGRELFAVFDSHDTWPQPAVMADIASIFGLSDSVGGLIRGDGGNRHSRRTRAGKLRHIQAALDAGEM